LITTVHPVLQNIFISFMHPVAVSDAAAVGEAVALDLPPSIAAANLDGEIHEPLQGLQAAFSHRSVPPCTPREKRPRNDLQDLHEDQTAEQTPEEGHWNTLEGPAEIASSDGSSVCRSTWKDHQAGLLPIMHGADPKASSGRPSSQLFEATGSNLGVPMVPRSRASIVEAGELATEPTVVPTYAETIAQLEALLQGYRDFDDTGRDITDATLVYADPPPIYLRRARA
jgi:hypothetical protein